MDKYEYKVNGETFFSEARAVDAAVAIGTPIHPGGPSTSCTDPPQGGQKPCGGPGVPSANELGDCRGCQSALLFSILECMQNEPVPCRAGNKSMGKFIARLEVSHTHVPAN